MSDQKRNSIANNSAQMAIDLMDDIKIEGEENLLLIMKTRKQLNQYSFDPSVYLENSINISSDPVGQEEILFQLFDELTTTFTEMSKEIEEDVLVLQDAAKNAEKILMNELQSSIVKLSTVGDSVDSVKLGFDTASEGAVRIGSKLSSAERERSHIEKSIELLGYIKIFQETPIDKYKKQFRGPRELKESLPIGLQPKEWGEISQILHDLKIILFELNSTDVENAQKNINRLADRVEVDLLFEFEKIVIALFEKKTDPDRLFDRAKDLADWLHLFNNGASIQKRYIFTVVQYRIPNDTFFQTIKKLGEKEQAGVEKKSRIGTAITNTLKWFTFSRRASSTVTKPKENNKKVNKQVVLNNNNGDDDDNESSDGYSSGNNEDEDNDDNDNSNNLTHYNPVEVTLMDHLSGLFKMINKVCQEQFSIIMQIFPENTVARVARMLVQRIFNDPAFGIQSRVDAILCPVAPSPPLNLADYLDALVLVREKLSALYLLLLECCSHPYMRGMGSESGSLKKAGQPIKLRKPVTTVTDYNLPLTKTPIPTAAQIRNMMSIENQEQDVEEVLRSDAEIREFFDDQISQVISSYLIDYFEREFLLVRNRYTEILTSTINESNILSKPSQKGLLYNIPLLKFDKLKSFSFIVQNIGNNRYLDRIFAITTDAVYRMESIGRDDRKLPIHLRDLFLFQLEYLRDVYFFPWLKFINFVLLKQILKTNFPAIPPIESLALISTITYGVNRIKTHFEEVFSRPISIIPNAIAVCKENRMKTFRELDIHVRESICVWIMNIINFIDKTLMTIQSKFDYAPKFETISASNNKAIIICSTACETVCKGLSDVMSGLNQYKSKLIGLDMMKLFWKPIGIQVIGLIISHIRRQKITYEGAKVLIKDIKEYSKYLMLSECPEIIDMMICLKELCIIFTVRAENLVKLVVEDLRHLDTSIILAFVKSRADFQSRNPKHYSNVLSNLLSNYKWDTPLFWEKPRKPVNAAYLTEAVLMGSKWATSLGPITLRRAGSGPNDNRQVSALFMSEIARANSVTASQLSAGGRSVSIDISKLDDTDTIDNLPVTALKPADMSWEEYNRRSYSSGFNGGSSQFLPSRPDDIISNPSSSMLSNAANNQKAGNASISRPDLMNSSNSTIKQRTKSIIRGSAATLLSSVNLKRLNSLTSSNRSNSISLSNNKTNINTNYNEEKELTSNRNKDVDVNDDNNNSDISYAGDRNVPKSRKMLNKMTSFFQR